MISVGAGHVRDIAVTMISDATDPSQAWFAPAMRNIEACGRYKIGDLFFASCLTQYGLDYVFGKIQLDNRLIFNTQIVLGVLLLKAVLNGHPFLYSIVPRRHLRSVTP